MKLIDSVHLVGSGSEGIGLTNSYDGNVYYVDCGSEAILIDAGSGCDSCQIIQQIALANPKNKPVTKLFLTHHHCDHAGGANDFKRHFNCMVYAPRLETPSITSGDEAVLGLELAKKAGFYPPEYHFKSCPVDFTVSPGQIINFDNISITVFDGSGHSLGGVCYYLRKSEKNILFVGDLLSFHGLISLQNIPGADISHYSKSVLALENLPVDCFFPGHGCFSLSNGYLHIEKAVSAFKKLGIPQNTV